MSQEKLEQRSREFWQTHAGNWGIVKLMTEFARSERNAVIEKAAREFRKRAESAIPTDRQIGYLGAAEYMESLAE